MIFKQTFFRKQIKINLIKDLIPVETSLLLKVALESENVVTSHLFSTADRTTNASRIKQTEDFGALRSTIFMQTSDLTFGVTVNK